KAPGCGALGSWWRAPSSLLRQRFYLFDLDLSLGDLDVHVLLREPVRGHLLLPQPLLPRRLFAEDVLEDVVDVDRAALHAPRRIDSVLTELELDDRVRGVPDGPVLLDLEVFERVDQPSLHVARAGRPHGGIDQAFPAAHRVEEVFRRMEAALVRRLDEAFRLRSEVSFLEVREGAVPISAAEPLPTDGLLADRSRHLGEVQHRAARPGARHDHRAVLDPEVLARDLSREVSRPAEDLHRLDLERFLEGPTRHLLELASLVRFDEALDLLDGGLQ